MYLAYVMTRDRGAMDPLLTAFAQKCLREGHRVAGIVQSNTPRPDTHHCDMDVKVLPDGPVFRISQSLGRQARGCRLDPEALENAVATVQNSLSASADLMIVNKFGKHEAEGRGFRDLIAEALEKGTPVLVGVNRLNLDAFLDFSGDLAVPLDPGIASLTHWFDAIRTQSKEAAQ